MTFSCFCPGGIKFHGVFHKKSRGVSIKYSYVFAPMEFTGYKTFLIACRILFSRESVGVCFYRDCGRICTKFYEKVSRGKRKTKFVHAHTIGRGAYA